MRPSNPIAIIVFLSSFPLALRAQVPSDVPPDYSALYETLGDNITSFQDSFPAAGSYPVAFAAELLSASSNLGPKLLTNSYTGVLMELDSLKAMGVGAVKVSIHFPILYPAYYQDPNEYLHYLQFYARLAQDIHARGLKMVVESGILVNEPGLTNTDATFYNSLTLAQYEAGRAEVAALIAKYVKPDYLSVLNEPDTEAAQTGQAQLATPSGSLAFLKNILAGLQQVGVSGVPIGAGVGTWMPSYSSFINAYVTTPIQFIDMHVFPVTNDYLSRATEIAQIAKSAGKDVSISQAWLEKATSSDLQSVSYSQLAARDPFSFWQPLDTSFLQAMTTFARGNHLAFFSPFYSAYFHAYLNYDDDSSLSVGQLVAQLYSQVAQNISTGQFTPTAVAYSTMISNGPDTTAPSIPANLEAASRGSAATYISWDPATDNVGVAGYAIYRGGTLIATTSGTYYYDLNLSAATTYTYQVTAYDVAGNVSAPAGPVSATTLR